jgi:hypothetical protein
MFETVINQAMVGFFIACAVAIPFGFLVGSRFAGESGIAAGCLLIGVAGCASAGWLGWHQWQWTRDSVVTEGVLLSFGGETGTRAGAAEGDRTDDSESPDGPLVRFRADDGSTHEVRGLAGGLREHQVGDAVAVRYRPSDPSQAQIDDFQNLWGGVWAMTAFGVLPLLFGVFFVHATITGDPARAQAPRRSVRAGSRGGNTAKDRAQQRRRERIGGRLIQAALIVMVGSLMLGAAWPDLDALPSIGYAFIGVAAGLLLMLSGLRMGQPDATQQTLILLILFTGFALFGVGAVLLAG